MDSNYQLINSVDPSKCRARIRDKFAKLTLSSNKKKQSAEMQAQIRENVALSNVSRNLMNDLLTDDESDDERVEAQQKTENLILRTDSSPSEDNVAAKKVSMQSANTTHCTEAEESAVMEPLQVSDTDNVQTQQNLDNVIEKLSSRVSMLTVEGPLTISSEGSPLSVSRIVSTENQRIESGRTHHDVTLRSNVEEQVEDSVCISSSTEESAITISDSSASEDDLEVNMTPSYCSQNPQTLDAVKEERMAKFLHDVKKNYGLAATPEPDFEDRCRQIATADTEPMSSGLESQSLGTARRIATADTESMSPFEEYTVAEQEKDAQNTLKANLASADTEDMTNVNETIMSSPRYDPVMKVGTEFLDDSIKHTNDSLPEDSLTIAETSDEEEHKNNSSQALRESNSPQVIRESNSPQVIGDSTSPSEQSKRYSSSSDQDSQFKINISAKINIKIQFSGQQQLEESASSNSTAPSPHNSSSLRESLEQQPHSSAQKGLSQHSALESIPHSPPDGDIPPQTPKSNIPPIDDYDEAKRLLNELYGDTWKTPKVIHSLKKITVKRNPRRPPPKKEEIQPNLKDESSVCDFSIFRQNIPQHLDSTRLPESPSTFKTPFRRQRKDSQTPEETAPPKTPGTQLVKTKSGRMIQQRLVSIVDSDTESEEEKPSERCSLKSSDEEDIDSKPSTGAKPKRGKPGINRSQSPNEDDLACSVSTRSPEPPSAFKTPRTAGRCPRFRRQRIDSQTSEETSPLKPRGPRLVKTKSGRMIQQKLANVVDTDTESEGENASVGSNQSWKLSDEEDIENKPKNEAKPKRVRRKVNKCQSPKKDDLVYLDLTKDEVEIQHDVSGSPPANHDSNFNRRLEEILQTCKPKEKPKIERTPNTTSKRKLFTPVINDDDECATPPPFDSPKERLLNVIADDASVSISGGPLPSIFGPFNKHLEAVKQGKPIFKVQTPKPKRDEDEATCTTPRAPKSVLTESRVFENICNTPKDKYSFLKSLDLCVGKAACHPDALYYRENYRLKKEELAGKLYDIYNRRCFNGGLDVPLRWNKKLTNTAGRCMNKTKSGVRSCVIELSEKVLTSADRLRCTLIHELCHAATWIYEGAGGHGAAWKAWARKANQTFPELPKIGVCHQYDIEYKYTYKCTLCGAKSHAHSKSKKVENIRCSYCHGAIEVYLNKKDKEGNIMPTPVKEPAGFAKFVKDKYKTYKTPDLKHADVMKLLSNEFAAMKVGPKS